jgi:tRNA dimethylallyltransferase
MDIGTAKPNSFELKQVPHHLVDIRDPNEAFTAGEFFRANEKAFADIHSRGKRPLVVGGTGFYLKTLLFGLWEAPPANADLRNRLQSHSNEELHQSLLQIDPTSAQRIGTHDRYRLIRALELYQLTGRSPTELQNQISQQPDPRFHLWILDRPSLELNERIRLRTRQMIEQGLIQEYQRIFDQYPESRALKAIGYAQVGAYLRQELPQGRKVKPGLDGLSDEIELATRQLVKSQRTWFRGQTTSVPQSQWFLLDQDRSRLEEAVKSVYDHKY